MNLISIVPEIIEFTCDYVNMLFLIFHIPKNLDIFKKMILYEIFMKYLSDAV